MNIMRGMPKWAGLLVLPLAVLAPMTGCSNPGQGAVTGHLSRVGGPAPGAPTPMAAGTVVADGPGGRHTVSITPDGRYTLTLPPGTYTLTGSGPEYLDGRTPCAATATVTVKPGQVIDADVYCQVK